MKITTLTLFAFYMAILIGWIMNLYQVVVGITELTTISAMSGLMVLKIVGIFFAPLGAILGYMG